MLANRKCPCPSHTAAINHPHRTTKSHLPQIPPLPPPRLMVIRPLLPPPPSFPSQHTRCQCQRPPVIPAPLPTLQIQQVASPRPRCTAAAISKRDHHLRSGGEVYGWKFDRGHLKRKKRRGEHEAWQPRRIICTRHTKEGHRRGTCFGEIVRGNPQS